MILTLYAVMSEGHYMIQESRKLDSIVREFDPELFQLAATDCLV